MECGPLCEFSDGKLALARPKTVEEISRGAGSNRRPPVYETGDNVGFYV